MPGREKPPKKKLEKRPKQEWTGWTVQHANSISNKYAQLEQAGTRLTGLQDKLFKHKFAMRMMKESQQGPIDPQIKVIVPNLETEISKLQMQIIDHQTMFFGEIDAMVQSPTYRLSEIDKKGFSDWVGKVIKKKERIKEDLEKIKTPSLDITAHIEQLGFMISKFESLEKSLNP